MKRFDYLCLLYCVLLLVFGFDDPPEQTPAQVPAQTRAFHSAATPAHSTSAEEKNVANVSAPTYTKNVNTVTVAAE